MMQRYFLYILFGILALPSLGQGVPDYYELPARSPQYNRVLARYGAPQIRDRWYVAFDAFVRTDRAQLNDNLNGAIESNLVGKVGWGVTLGWAFRERWMVEGGYVRSPIHTQLSVANANPPVVLRSTNDRNAFTLRAKRLLFSTSGPWLRSGFWVSGGAWAVPNSNQDAYQTPVLGRRSAGKWESAVDFQVSSQTQSHTGLATLAELGAEYNVRLTNEFDLGVSVRKLWGLSTSLNTDVTYTVNRVAPQQTQLLGNGSGMTYGATLRYTFASRRTKANVLNVQGRTPMGKIR